MVSFFYSKDGVVYKNDENRPLDLIGEAVFRFAYDKDINKIFVQDPSFQRRLAKGDKEAWSELDSTLLAIERNFGARFPDRAFGDPPDWVYTQKLSSFTKAWDYLKSYLMEEFESLPIDLVVLQKIQVPAESVSFFANGASVGQSEPTLVLNRHFGSPEEDVSFDRLNKLVVSGYLKNLEEIAKAHPQAWPYFEQKIKDLKSSHRLQRYFAIMHNNEAKIFHHPGGDEDQIKEKLGTDVTTLVFNPKNKTVCFENQIPAKLAKELIQGIFSKIAATNGVSPKELIVSFDAELRIPFYTELRRYHWVKDCLRASGGCPNIYVLEAPLDVKNDVALVESSDKEDEACQKSKRYRAVHGISLKYPFLLVDSRCKNRGKKYRSMIEAVRPEFDPLGDLEEKDFLMTIENPKIRLSLQDAMVHMVEIGMDKDSILDFFAGTTLYKRAEFYRLFKEAMSDEKRVIIASKEANFGDELEIQNWWSTSEPPVPLKSKPKGFFNLKNTKKPKIKSYEELLDSQRAKFPASQKGVEQLLHENRI